MQLLLRCLGAALLIATAAAADRPQNTGSLTPVQEAVVTENACNVTEPVKDRPPDDPHADSWQSPIGMWYANDERTLWAWWWGKRAFGDYKVLWVRPVGTELKIAGRRLDADAAPLTAKIAQHQPWTFQTSAIDFPTPGCWQVEGTAGEATLTFIVDIR